MEVLTGPPKDTHRSEHQEIVFLYHLGQGNHVFAFHAHCSESQEEVHPIASHFIQLSLILSAQAKVQSSPHLQGVTISSISSDTGGSSECRMVDAA